MARARVRFTIAGLMGIVLLVAIAFAALRTASVFWASAMFSIAIVSVSVALVRTLVLQGKTRMPWGCYAALGLVSLLLWFWVEPLNIVTAPPHLLVSWALQALMPYVNPTAVAGGEAYVCYQQICSSLEVIVLGLVGAIIGRLIAGTDKQ